jgi:TonB family protein
MGNRFLLIIVLVLLCSSIYSTYIPYEDPPEPYYCISPVYPEKGLEQHMEGTVALEVMVYKSGEVGKITVRKSMHKDFDDAAVEAVKKWKFHPGKDGGKPVDTTVIIPIEFSLENYKAHNIPNKVTIHSYPDKAYFSINGEYKGQTNMDISLLPDTPYKILIAKPGYETIEQDIAFFPYLYQSSHEYTYYLEKASPTLNITSSIDAPTKPDTLLPINSTEPVYPEKYKNLPISGTVWLEVEINSRGLPISERVYKSLIPGPGGFDEVALLTVKKWKFQPNKSGRKAIKRTIIVPVEFDYKKH